MPQVSGQSCDESSLAAKHDKVAVQLLILLHLGQEGQGKRPGLNALQATLTHNGFKQLKHLSLSCLILGATGTNLDSLAMWSPAIYIKKKKSVPARATQHSAASHDVDCKHRVAGTPLQGSRPTTFHHQMAPTKWPRTDTKKPKPLHPCLRSCTVCGQQPPFLPRAMLLCRFGPEIAQQHPKVATKDD